MPRLRAALVASALTIACGTAAGAVAALDTPAASAAAAICDEYGRTTTADGRYVVQNNRWGTQAQQCITPSATGFELTTAEGDVPTTGAPASYPSVYWGCHYATCTPDFSPVPASSAEFATVRTSTTMAFPADGSWDAAYDLWFDPTPRRDGQNTGAEVMVWLDHSGPPQPIGSRVGRVSIEGADWDVWFGNQGWNVVSYVRTTPTTTVDVAVASFFEDALARGYTERSWYLTSVQAGFEPWEGGAGLSVTAFEAGPVPATVVRARPRDVRVPTS